ncbi:MAG: DUF5684 domain-containing protein [Actinomycetota bacterium]|nr:DUF5684 domain-containing protein [Actinomycetota bacterium]
MEVTDSDTIITIALIAVGVILYIYTAFCFQRIAKNLGVRPSWFAWIPILDIYLWCRICGKGVLWTILFFIPIVNIVIYVMLCLKLAHACDRSGLLGVLLILPIVNLIVLWVLAKGSRSRGVERRG